MIRSQIIKQQRLYLSYLPHVREEFGNLPGVHTPGLGAKEKAGKILEEWTYGFYVNITSLLTERLDFGGTPGLKTNAVQYFKGAQLIGNTSGLFVQGEPSTVVRSTLR